MVGSTAGGQLIAAWLWLATPEAPPAPVPDQQLLLYLAEFGDDEESAPDPVEFEVESVEATPASEPGKKDAHVQQKEP